MSIEQQARELLRALCLLPIRAGQEAEIALIVAALASQPQAPAAAVPEGMVLIQRADLRNLVYPGANKAGHKLAHARAKELLAAAPAPEVSG